MSGTTTALDAAALGRWLASRGEPVVGQVAVERIGLGQSNLTYLVQDDDSHRWVARRPPLGTLLASAHDVAREHRILTSLAGTSVPTPGVVGLVEDDAVCAAPLLVVEHVDGLVVDRMDVAEAMTEEQRSRVGPGLAEVLAGLHAVDLDEVGLQDLASHSSYAQRQLKRWTRQWEASRTRDLPDLERLTGWLRDHVPQRTSLSVVHGDLHIRNVILDPGTAAVRAVLDWELCTLGDPLADLGSTLAYWPEAGDPWIGLFDATRLPGFSSRRDVAEAYAVASGRDLEDLAFWEALGMWKVAIIVEGVRRRARDEPANAAEGGPPPAELTDGLVARALDLTT